MRKQVVFLLFCLLSFYEVWAQTPCFLAYNTQNQVVTTFCVGERITFKDNSGQSNVTEFYDFDSRDGLDFSALQTSHTFTSPGQFTVTQLKGVGQTCPITYTVKANPPDRAPILLALETTASGIKIKISSSAINDVVLQRASSGAGPFTDVETISAVPAGESDHSVNLPQTTGCFRIKVTNLCTGEGTFISNILCSQDLIVEAGDRQNLLNWTLNHSSGSVVNYQIYRSGAPYQLIPSTQTSFIDQQVACGRLYTYAVAAIFSDGLSSRSAPVLVETQGTTPPAAPLLVASFDLENKVQLQTTVPVQETFKEQTIFKSLNGGVFSLFLEKQAKNTQDPASFILNQPACYQASYLDSCQLQSPRSNTSCPAVLSANYQPESGAVTLSWNQYDGFPGGIESQTLELLNDEGEVYWSTLVSGQSFVDVQPQQEFQRLRYRLLSKAQQAGIQSYSNTATIDQPFQFSFPNAFSPNGDGLNDVFRPVGKFASKLHFQILNRWGQVIFESTSPEQGWDGTYNGQPALPETYLYRFEAEDVTGKRIVKSGKVTLVR